MDYTNYYINKYNNSTLKTNFETVAQTKLKDCYYYLKICRDIIVNNELLSDDARSNNASSICGKLDKYCKMLDPNATGEDTIKGKIDKKLKEIKANAEKCDGWYKMYSDKDRSQPEQTMVTINNDTEIKYESTKIYHETNIQNDIIVEREKKQTVITTYPRNKNGETTANNYKQKTTPATYTNWQAIVEMSN